MQYEILNCSDNEAEFIEEQADQVFNTIAPPEPGAEEEEFVYKVTDEFVMPMALDRFLKDHTKVNTLLLHLDSDEVGRSATQGIIDGLGDKFRVIDSPAPDAKDVNEYLCNLKK